MNALDGAGTPRSKHHEGRVSRRRYATEHKPCHVPSQPALDPLNLFDSRSTASSRQAPGLWRHQLFRSLLEESPLSALPPLSNPILEPTLTSRLILLSLTVFLTAVTLSSIVPTIKHDNPNGEDGFQRFSCCRRARRSRRCPAWPAAEARQVGLHCHRPHRRQLPLGLLRQLGHALYVSILAIDFPPGSLVLITSQTPSRSPRPLSRPRLPQ